MVPLAAVQDNIVSFVIIRKSMIGLQPNFSSGRVMLKRP
jgi:hypothetical protein